MQRQSGKTVGDVMSRQVISITPEESVALAARLLARYTLGALPVCTEGGKLVGIITDRDIVIRSVADPLDPATLAVEEIMSRNVEWITPQEPLHTAALRMARRQIRRLPVVENGNLVGMLSLGDLAIQGDDKMEAAEALEEISRNLRRGS
jgi:CBS domain-containing protein